jgi:hypothetical protein
LDYHPFYCEENVWRLNRSGLFRRRERWVVFIFSPSGACPLFGQKAAAAGEPVFWDYHVVLMAFEDGETWVWDLDSTHGAPSRGSVWFSVTMPQLESLPQGYHPRFRVIEGQVFDEVFSSDRSHMRDADGGYLKDPPPWPAPFQPERGMNLMEFAVSGSAAPGEELSWAQFVDRIS